MNLLCISLEIRKSDSYNVYPLLHYSYLQYDSTHIVEPVLLLCRSRNLLVEKGLDYGPECGILDLHGLHEPFCHLIIAFCLPDPVTSHYNVADLHAQGLCDIGHWGDYLVIYLQAWVIFVREIAQCAAQVEIVVNSAISTDDTSSFENPLFLTV